MSVRSNEQPGERGTATIRTKRAYEPRARGDGRRILVERLWPRGMSKDFLDAHAWMKEVAPSTELRKWFAHRVARWPEFRRHYIEELNANPDTWTPILDASRRGAVTLLYSAHDAEHNSAVVLRDYLLKRLSRRGRGTKSSDRDLAAKPRTAGRRARQFLAPCGDLRRVSHGRQHLQ
jgi:uncharacterized protein YeaO (DUF488 family)